MFASSSSGRAIDGGVSCVVIKRADELLSESGTTIRK